MSLYLCAPKGWQIKYQATLGEVVKTSELRTFNDAWGWSDFAPIATNTTTIAVELLEAVPPQAKA